MPTGIYAIKNKVNGKLYIGQSIHIKERWKQHIAELDCNSHCNYKIQNEWETYGRHSFEFFPCSDYISLPASSFDKIVKIKTSIKREVLLNTYLYVKSFIYDYQPNSDDTYTPYGFYGNLLLACDELGYTRKTVDACMDLFVICGIFKCYLTGSYKKINGTVANAPNIYVLNDENADKNIRLLLEKMQTQYNVDKFMPQVYKGNSLKSENCSSPA